MWADTLSSQRSTLEWALSQDTFDILQNMCSRHHRWMASLLQTTIIFPVYLIHFVAMAAGDPDAFTVAWNRWTHLFLFPHLATEVHLRVGRYLRTYKGHITLVTPLWRAQPWNSELLQWCQTHLPSTRQLFGVQV